MQYRTLTPGGASQGVSGDPLFYGISVTHSTPLVCQIQSEQGLVHCGMRLNTATSPKPLSAWAFLTLATPLLGVAEPFGRDALDNIASVCDEFVTNLVHIEPDRAHSRNFTQNLHLSDAYKDLGMTMAWQVERFSPVVPREPKAGRVVASHLPCTIATGHKDLAGCGAAG
mgnify:CR=1 FL=1